MKIMNSKGFMHSFMFKIVLSTWQMTAFNMAILAVSEISLNEIFNEIVHYFPHTPVFSTSIRSEISITTSTVNSNYSCWLCSSNLPCNFIFPRKWKTHADFFNRLIFNRYSHQSSYLMLNQWYYCVLTVLKK